MSLCVTLGGNPEQGCAACRRQDTGSAPMLLALDCEMCATATDASALVRVCVVDALGAPVLDVSLVWLLPRCKAELQALARLCCLKSWSFSTRTGC